MRIFTRCLALFISTCAIASTLWLAACGPQTANNGGGGGGTGGNGGGGGGGGGGTIGGDFTSDGNGGVANPEPTALKAFPEAEGFGAHVSGGRGGRVIYVTTLNADGPGSLKEALDATGPRTILFKVSGLIDRAAEIIHGDVTIAGQTSPGGIIVRGLLCDRFFDNAGETGNIIARHLRSRPRDMTAHPSPNYILDDALRLDGCENFIGDHLSLANGTDETVQISRSANVTIQDSMLAELIGDHAYLGGMLINYSAPTLPQDNLSIHHNLWNRIGGRMPEISCEIQDQDNCAGRAIDIELSDNMAWDPQIEIWYNPSVEQGNDNAPHFHLNLNWVNNFWSAGGSFTHGMLLQSFVDESGNDLFLSGDQLNLYPAFSGVQMVSCCDDYNATAPYAGTPAATILAARHDFPAITYTPTADLQQYMIDHVGAFPRDPMDQRLIGYLQNNTHNGALIDTDQGDAWNTNPAPAAPTDSDDDGMPDTWETGHGLDPNTASNNGTELSSNAANGIAGCTSGYTNLECYLNELAANLL